jgi:hypothetical protein
VQVLPDGQLLVEILFCWQHVCWHCVTAVVGAMVGGTVGAGVCKIVRGVGERVGKGVGGEVGGVGLRVGDGVGAIQVHPVQY